MSNKFVIEIDQCDNCPHWKLDQLTPYCTLEGRQTHSLLKRDDDEDLMDFDIPDWCPMLLENRTE